jgi:hypothetical protein
MFRGQKQTIRRVMETSHRQERSIVAALALMGGWGNSIIGAFIIVFAGRSDLRIAAEILLAGLIMISVVYWREHLT